MECPYCHRALSPDTPCLCHPPVPMSYWPSDAERKDAVFIKVAGASDEKKGKTG
jgi:hypothetical protein